MRFPSATKYLYLSATALSTAFALPAQATNFPTGFFIAIDPNKPDELSFLQQAAEGGGPADYQSLFGTFSGTCPGTTCKGGIIGIFLKVNWMDYQAQQLNSGHTTLSVVTDNSDPLAGGVNYEGNVETALHYINELEGTLSVSSTQTLALSIGLEAGYNASFQALDIYQLSSGNSYITGTSLNYTTSDEISCSFQTSDSGSIIVGNGGTSSTGSLFPQQCTLKSATPYQCNSEANIFATDTASETSNGYYVSAYSAAMADLAHQITSGGTTSTGSHVPGHVIDILKLTGVADHDVEVGVDGNPAALMPTSGSTTYSCGFVYPNGTPATDAEAIWTDQSNSGTNYYDTGVMESTFDAIASNVVTLAGTPTGGTISNFAIDVYGDNDFPPVGPRHCHYPTQCTYTPAGSSSIVTFTTGEEEYLIETELSNGGFSGAIAPSHFSIQTQGLSSTSPSVGESKYYTNEIPCAMQAHYNSIIGYQSLAGFTFSSSSDQTTYLDSLANGATYGAVYEELIPNELVHFIDYGTASTDLADLSSEMYTVSQSMATNQINTNTSELCTVTTGTFTTY